MGLTKTSKLVLATVASVTVFGSVYGFAASLGVSTSGLGADNKVVASCGSGMAFSYSTSYYSGIPGYAVSAVNVTNIPAGCQSKSLAVTFTDASNNPIGTEITSTLPASGTTKTVSITPSSNTIDASNVSGVSVVVS